MRILKISLTRDYFKRLLLPCKSTHFCLWYIFNLPAISSFRENGLPTCIWEDHPHQLDNKNENVHYLFPVTLPFVEQLRDIEIVYKANDARTYGVS